MALLYALRSHQKRVEEAVNSPHEIRIRPRGEIAIHLLDSYLTLSSPFNSLLQRMVNPTAPIALNEDTAETAEPGIGRYSQDEPSYTTTTTNTTELNPTLLHKRLLQAISPATTTGGKGLRSSSEPNLIRNNSLGGTSASHAQSENDAINPKLLRTGTDITTLTMGIGGASANGPNLQSGAGTPRPPLLSKKLLEPKVPIGENPTFKECYMNTIKYSWLNVLLIFVPVSFSLFSLQVPTCQANFFQPD